MIVVIPVRSTGPYPVADGIELDSQALYWASAADVVRAAIESGGEVLVNYQGEDASPVETLLADHGIALESLRFEPQVGSTRSARLGNSVTHLLEEEDATSVAVLEPTAPLVRRPVIDGVAMSLRRTDVILGPSLAGGCYVAGYTQPIDFADVYAEQPLEAIDRPCRRSRPQCGYRRRLADHREPGGPRDRSLDHRGPHGGRTSGTSCSRRHPLRVSRCRVAGSDTFNFSGCLR
ncbi:MAG: DUF2064 domain-containing protein [Natrialbaceae archaeon]|nr:DUF2064 domain-containing protein [Natrialbaceae archaeon]